MNLERRLSSLERTLGGLSQPPDDVDEETRYQSMHRIVTGLASIAKTAERDGIAPPESCEDLCRRLAEMNAAYASNRSEAYRAAREARESIRQSFVGWVHLLRGRPLST